MTDRVSHDQPPLNDLEEPFMNLEVNQEIVDDRRSESMQDKTESPRYNKLMKYESKQEPTRHQIISSMDSQGPNRDQEI